MRTPKENTSGNKKEISIIIPSAPDRSFSKIVENLRRVKPDGIAMQVIVVKGTWPPIQRNLGIKKATGEYIFLFDDDIEIPAGTIEKVLLKFKRHPKIAVIGGPNLTPPENNFIQHCFGFAHGSWFTAGKTSARYSPSKESITANEDTLISCNLAFRGEKLKANPFDPAIFPNEENDLLARMSMKGVGMIYTPEFFVYHHRRKTFRAYFTQIFNWGKGRMKRTIARPKSFSPSFFVPLVFLLYLISLAVFQTWWYALPLLAYLLLDIWFSIESARKNRRPCYFWVMLVIFPLTHIFYALGLIWGIQSGLAAKNSEHQKKSGSGKTTPGQGKNSARPEQSAKNMHLIEIHIS